MEEKTKRGARRGPGSEDEWRKDRVKVRMKGHGDTVTQDPVLVSSVLLACPSV